jgi:predicted nucleic acid-binding protein
MGTVMTTTATAITEDVAATMTRAQLLATCDRYEAIIGESDEPRPELSTAIDVMESVLDDAEAAERRQQQFADSFDDFDGFRAGR